MHEIRHEIKKIINTIVTDWYLSLIDPGSGINCINPSPNLKNRTDIQAIDMWLFNRALEELKRRLNNAI